MKICENNARLMPLHDVRAYGRQLELQFYSRWRIARARPSLAIRVNVRRGMTPQ